MRILPSHQVDLKGRPVDVFDNVWHLYAVHFRNEDEELGRAELLELVLPVLEDIRTRAPKAIRKREIPLWFAAFVGGHGDPLVSICFPPRFSSRIITFFADALSKHLTLFEMETVGAFDIGARPLVRYTEDCTYVYETGPTEHQYQRSHLEARRARQTRRPPRRPTGPREPTPVLDAPLSLERWQDLQPDVVRFLFFHHGGWTWRTLARVTRQLGYELAVSKSARRFGDQNLGFSTARLHEPELFDGCRLRICLRGGLSERQRTVVLGHELGHCVNHFPVLYWLSFFDEVGLALPEARLAFVGRLTELFGRKWWRLERDADEFASYLFVPLVADRVGESTYRPGSRSLANELAWTWLHNWFDELSSVQFDEPEWPNVVAKAEAEASRSWRDSLAANDDYFARLFAACVSRRDFANRDDTKRRIVQANDFARELVDVVCEEERSSDHRVRLAHRFASLIEVAKGQHTVPSDLASNRTVFEALRPRGHGLPHAIGLARSPGNARGRRKGAWRPLRAGAPERTLHEWRELHPHSKIILYED